MPLCSHSDEEWANLTPEEFAAEMRDNVSLGQVEFDGLAAELGTAIKG